MKRFARWAALGLLLSLLLLCGCQQVAYQPMDWQEAELPAPPETRMDAPNTDSVPVRTLDVELYMRSADGAMLMPVSTALRVDYTQDAAQVLMEQLLAAEEEGLVNPVPAGTRLLSVEHTNRTVTVDLSIDAYNVDGADDLLWMDTAIARTLGTLENVDYVNLLIGGRKYSLDGLTMGAMPVQSANATLLWAQSRTEAEYFAQTDGSYAIDRTAILYYPAVSGGNLLPVAAPVRFSAENAVEVLLESLTELPEGVHGVRAAFDVLPEFEQHTVVTEDGRRVIKIDFAEGSWSRIAQKDAGTTCAAAALTLISVVPEIDGVVFCADDMLITEYEIDGERFVPEMGVLTREGLRSRIGAAVDLYYGSPAGNALSRVTRVLSPMVEHYPRMLLGMLMEGPAAGDEAVSAIPEGISTEDVLGISLSDGVMQVNLSANFYRLCQPLSGDAERKLVYSIVNTLCNLDSVNAVQFFVEGGQAEVLSESMYLHVPLMANPGLVIGDQPEETAAPDADPAKEEENA